MTVMMSFECSTAMTVVIEFLITTVSIRRVNHSVMIPGMRLSMMTSVVVVVMMVFSMKRTAAPHRMMAVMEKVMSSVMNRRQEKNHRQANSRNHEAAGSAGRAVRSSSDLISGTASINIRGNRFIYNGNRTVCNRTRTHEGMLKIVKI